MKLPKKWHGFKIYLSKHELVSEKKYGTGFNVTNIEKYLCKIEHQVGLNNIQVSFHF